MKRLYIAILIISIGPGLFAQEANQKAKYSESKALIKPSLFADLGPSCSTPDGMALDKKSHLFLAVGNLTSFEQYGSKIISFDSQDLPYTWYDQLPLHPISKRVHPMGIEFGSDGHLYIADNQSFVGLANESRILRVLVKDGKAVGSEVLVEGLNFANGIRINNNRIYLTDFSLATNNESAIYSFSIKELNKEKLKLDEQSRAKYQLAKFPQGIDGIAFDKKGDLYAGHFFNGSITKIEFSKKGVLKSRQVVFDSEELKCADGMFYDLSRNSIFIANLSNNSIHQFNLSTNIIDLIWVNDNSNGADGSLDNPCETIIYKGELIVVNFDTFQGLKNQEVDEYNTISRFILSN